MMIHQMIPQQTFRRAAFFSLALLAFGALLSPAYGQVTVRIEPLISELPRDPGTTPVEVFLDNVPALDPNGQPIGLTAFSVQINLPAEDANSPINACTLLENTDFDPTLLADWGGALSVPDRNASQAFSTSGGISTVLWSSRTTNPAVIGPSGTIRLGALNFRTDASPFDCSTGDEGQFNIDQGASMYGTMTAGTANTTFDAFQDGLYALVNFFDADLTIACTQVEPADPNGNPFPYFVDGDTITLSCDVENLGTEGLPPIGGGRQAIAVISGDEIVSSADNIIGNDTVTGNLQQPNTIETITLAGSPPFGIGGAIKFCGKIDVTGTSRPDLDEQDGAKIESDETNNVDCIDSAALTPARDLQGVPVDPDPNNFIPFTLRSGPLASDPAVNPDPNGNPFPAGTVFEIEYTVENAVDPNILFDPNIDIFDPANPQLGNALVREHRTSVFLVRNEIAFMDPATRLDGGVVIDPNIAELICFQKEENNPGIPGGTSITRTYGTIDDDDTNTDFACEIPFEENPGPISIGLAIDNNIQVVETDEADNREVFQIDVGITLPPDLRPAPKTAILNTVTQVIGSSRSPKKTRVPFSISSVKDLAEYEFTVTWSDPNLIDLADPNSDVVFEAFIETNGRVETCGVSAFDPVGGSITVGCTSIDPDPNNPSIGGQTPASEELLGISFDAIAPGSGLFTLSNVTGFDSLGTPVVINVTDGTYIVRGDPEIEMENPMVPLSVLPGQEFTVTYRLDNIGFGPAPVGTRSEVIVSQDTTLDISGGDTLACFRTEPVEIPEFSFVDVTLDTCLIGDDFRPGNYFAGFLAVGQPPDPSDIIGLQLPPRLVAVRKQGDEKRLLEVTLAPDIIGGSTLPVAASTRSFRVETIASLKSPGRGLNFLTGWRDAKKGRRVDLIQFPKGLNRPLERKGSLRLPGRNLQVLGGFDVDGNGEDELMLLSRKKGRGDKIDFRVVNFGARNPEVCVDLARSPVITGGKVIAAAGIDYDGDTSDGDELAVVTQAGSGDQTLTIYTVDLDPNAVLPASNACSVPQGGPIPPPAALTLIPDADDTGFGGQGNRTQSMCVLDSDLDGIEEIISLSTNGSGRQTVRVLQPPAGLGGNSVLIADDDAYGGTGGRRKVLSIACTR